MPAVVSTPALFASLISPAAKTAWFLVSIRWWMISDWNSCDPWSQSPGNVFQANVPVKRPALKLVRDIHTPKLDLTILYNNHHGSLLPRSHSIKCRTGFSQHGHHTAIMKVGCAGGWEIRRGLAFRAWRAGVAGLSSARKGRILQNWLQKISINIPIKPS